MKIFTVREFIQMTGSEPVQDDMNRLNCAMSGKVGHEKCGYCNFNELPKFMVLCINCGQCGKNE